MWSRGAPKIVTADLHRDGIAVLLFELLDLPRVRCSGGCARVGPGLSGPTMEWRLDLFLIAFARQPRNQIACTTNQLVSPRPYGIANARKHHLDSTNLARRCHGGARSAGKLIESSNDPAGFAGTDGGGYSDPMVLPGDPA
jgi:hypothetical protein